MQHGEKAKQNPKGKIEFLVWGTDEKNKKIDPSLYAALHGGNVGHAAIRVVIPQETIDSDKNLQAKIASFKKHLGDEAKLSIKEIEENFSVGNKSIKMPCCEIYFSFWPDDKKPRDLRSREQDMIEEWSGRRSPPLNRHRAKAIYKANDEELDQIISKTQSDSTRSVLDPRRFHKKTKYKKVYSGAKEIWHFDPNAMLAQLEASVMNSIKLIQKQIKQLGPHHPDSGLSDLLNRIENRLQNVNHLKEQEWNAESLEFLTRNMTSQLGHLKKYEPDADVIKQFEIDISKLTSSNYRTLGLDADHQVRFDAENFEFTNIIDAMQKMADKKYKTAGWNCASTALYVLMQGLPEPLKQDKEIDFYLKKLGGKNPPIYTPRKVEKIANMLQVKHLDYLGEQIRESRQAQREKEVEESMRALHKPKVRPNIFTLFQPVQGNDQRPSNKPQLNNAESSPRSSRIPVSERVKLFEELAEKEKPDPTSRRHGPSGGRRV